MSMAYTKTDWKARQGSGLNRFIKSGETENVVYLENAPDFITDPGTLFTPENMNHIEEGIAQAHSDIAAETQARDSLAAAINTEAQARQSDINALHYYIADIITLIESELGKLNSLFRLTIEGGFYLVTENNDYLVAT